MSTMYPSGGRDDDDPPSGSEAVAKLRLRLRHVPLSQLEAAGVVRWDEDDCVVAEGPKFDEARPGGGADR